MSAVALSQDRNPWLWRAYPGLLTHCAAICQWYSQCWDDVTAFRGSQIADHLQVFFETLRQALHGKCQLEGR